MLASFFQWLSDFQISLTVRESLWVFPALECLHIYSMIFLVTVVAAVDLRLLGLVMGRKPLSQHSRRALRWMWVCLGINAVSGALLFMSRAPDYYINSAFQIKILLVVLGTAYHSVLFHRVGRWDDTPAIPVGARLVGSFSLLLWVGVIAASRWIAFV